MCGGSKSVFFRAHDPPSVPAERDCLLPCVIGSPGPYGKHIDGMVRQLRQPHRLSQAICDQRARTCATMK